MSHLKTKHLKKYEEVRQKTEERKRSCKQASSNKRKSQLESQTTLTGIAAKKANPAVFYIRRLQGRLLV